MKTGWYWPLYGEDDEVAFTFAPSRSRKQVDTLLASFTGTLLSDGAAAYASFARERPELVHAQCWSHTRRLFVKAEDDEPAAVAEALALIGQLYAVEKTIGERQLEGVAKLDYRRAQALPAVDAFFAWVDAQCHRLELVPSSRLAKALAYAREREGALRVYLGDPKVAIDTNHLERALRPVPMGRKNWLFCWSEVGAEHVGVIQSLVTTCRLQGINRIPTSSTSCSASRVTRTRMSRCSRRGDGRPCSRTIRCALTSTSLPSNPRRRKDGTV